MARVNTMHPVTKVILLLLILGLGWNGVLLNIAVNRDSPLQFSLFNSGIAAIGIIAIVKFFK